MRTNISRREGNDYSLFGPNFHFESAGTVQYRLGARRVRSLNGWRAPHAIVVINWLKYVGVANARRCLIRRLVGNVREGRGKIVRELLRGGKDDYYNYGWRKRIYLGAGGASSFESFALI